MWAFDALAKQVNKKRYKVGPTETSKSARLPCWRNNMNTHLACSLGAAMVLSACGNSSDTEKGGSGDNERNSEAERAACTAAFETIQTNNIRQGVSKYFLHCSNFEPVPQLEQGAKIRVHYALEQAGDGAEVGLPPGRIRAIWLEGYQDCQVHAEVVQTQDFVQVQGCTFFDSPGTNLAGDWCGTPGPTPPDAGRLHPVLKK